MIASPVAGGILVSPASATTVLALNIEELTALSDRVIVGEVLSVTSDWESGRRRIISRIEVSVAESWKGAMPSARRVFITQLGGQVGDIEMRVHGLAQFRSGDRTVLFLQGPESAAQVTGFGLGVRRLLYDAGTARWMVLGADRTAAVVRRADGALAAAPPESADSLTALRDRVRALVQR